MDEEFSVTTQKYKPVTNEEALAILKEWGLLPKELLPKDHPNSPIGLLVRTLKEAEECQQD